MIDTGLRYAIARGGRGGRRPNVAHIVTRQVDWLPGAFECACGHFLRGYSLPGPTAEHPVCAPCQRYVRGERIR